MSSIVYKLNLRLGERFHADQARAITAKILSGCQPALMGELMHYHEAGDAGRIAKPGFPPIHFTSLSDGFGLAGFGQASDCVIRDVAPLLAHAWSKHLNRPAMIEMSEITTGIEKRPYDMRYVIPRVVVQKKSRHLEALKDPVKGKAFIEQLIERSIKTQGEHLGLKVHESLKVSLLGGEREFRAQLGHGNAALLGIKNLAFEVNASLSGYWSFGYIPSKGYGLMNADLVKSGVAYAIPK